MPAVRMGQKDAGSCVINVDALNAIDVDALDADGNMEIVYIGSPARARVLGINKGFRNFATYDAWLQAKRKDE